jgi:hypothetical protein
MLNKRQHGAPTGRGASLQKLTARAAIPSKQPVASLSRPTIVVRAELTHVKLPEQFTSLEDEERSLKATLKASEKSLLAKFGRPLARADMPVEHLKLVDRYQVVKKAIQLSRTKPVGPSAESAAGGAADAVREHDGVEAQPHARTLPNVSVDAATAHSTRPSSNASPTTARPLPPPQAGVLVPPSKEAGVEPMAAAQLAAVESPVPLGGAPVPAITRAAAEAPPSVPMADPPLPSPPQPAAVMGVPPYEQGTVHPPAAAQPPPRASCVPFTGAPVAATASARAAASAPSSVPRVAPPLPAPAVSMGVPPPATVDVHPPAAAQPPVVASLGSLGAAPVAAITREAASAPSPAPLPTAARPLPPPPPAAYMGVPPAPCVYHTAGPLNGAAAMDVPALTATPTSGTVDFPVQANASSTAYAAPAPPSTPGGFAMSMQSMGLQQPPHSSGAQWPAMLPPGAAPQLGTPQAAMPHAGFMAALAANPSLFTNPQMMQLMLQQALGPYGALTPTTQGVKPKREDKHKSRAADELDAELSKRFKEESLAAHAMVAHNGDGTIAVRAVSSGGGKMQCAICEGQPNIDCGKSQSGTLKHLISPGHYRAWYQASHSDVKLSESEWQATYNTFAHGKYKNKCSCPPCAKQRGLSGKKRSRDAPEAAAPSTAGAMPTATPAMPAALGNMAAWAPMGMPHAHTKSH